MNFLDFFNNEMKKVLLANPMFVELDEKRKHYALLRKELKENFSDILLMYSQNLNKIDFSKISTNISNMRQYIDQDYEDEIFNFKQKVAAFKDMPEANEWQKKLKSLEDIIENQVKPFLSKFGDEPFYSYYLEEPNIISNLNKIQTNAAKQLLIENLHSQELSDYATAIVKNDKLNINSFEYLNTLNKMLLEKYSQVLKEDYKLNKEVEDLFENKINESEAEI